MPAAKAPARTLRERLRPAEVAAWLIPFGAIVYLGMDRGGYGIGAYSQIGIVAWWLVGIGLLAGALPAARPGRSGWIALGLLAAFAAWTALGVSWSESSGRSVIEAARALVYVGVFAVALLAGGRPRLILGGVASGIAVIAVIALLSRLEPSWFPTNDLAERLDGVQARLAYPLGYWNALGGLIAFGLPLLVWAAASARTIAFRALAAAAVPAVALALYFTISRGGMVASAIALVALMLLWERRLSLVAPLAILAGGTGFLLWQAVRRPSLADGLTTSTADAQGERMILIAAGVGLIAAAAVAITAILARRGSIPPAPAVPRRPVLISCAVAVAVAAAAFVAAGGPGWSADRFEEFKEPAALAETSSRLQDASGNGRWQWWSVAVDAGEEEPLTGIGPGTFALYYTQNRDEDIGFIRDAHSLYAETFGELGAVGLLLIVGLVGLVIGTGTVRGLRAAGRDRLELAAATAATVGFAVIAGIDWVWEMPVVPIAFLIVAAAILRPRPRAGEERDRARIWPWPAGAAALLAAAAAIVSIAIPMRAGQHLAETEDAGDSGDIELALSEAEEARDLMPYAAAPRLEIALLYERLGQLKKAATAAQAAVSRESTNWETYYVLASIQAQRNGKEGSAVRALRRAQELDPYNPELNAGAVPG